MWVRKRIDIGIRDLLFGIAACFRRHRRDELQNRIADHWIPGQTLPCLSVRSGFDLLLGALKWPPGSEILMTGMTIADMPRIVRENRLVPVGIDLDVSTLSVSAEQIRARITPNTKAIVVAHLFGGLCDMEPVFEVAREHGLLVIEDCAQAYVGSHYRGDIRADVSMFSFGAIKTNTSLCGAVFVVRRPGLLNRLQKAHSRWPVQSRLTMLKRLFKYGFVKFLSTWLVTRMIARMLRLVGRNHNELAVKLSRGFSGGDFFARIRQQPSSPLLALMDRRFSNFDSQDVAKRTHRGLKLHLALRSTLSFPGENVNRPTWWVFPILVEDPQPLVECLWKHGFDAAHSCSMQPVVAPGERLESVEFILRHIVFLPFDLKMTAKEMRRMARLVRAGQPGRVTIPSAPQPVFEDHSADSVL